MNFNTKSSGNLQVHLGVDENYLMTLSGHTLKLLVGSAATLK